MELKNALAVCLIAFCSATLVVLIARVLDSQAQSRLEPQLASIAEELQALRKQGGVAASPGTASAGETAADGLIVYYFHSNTRCPTCQSIESQAKQTVQTEFASQVASGEVVWKVLNYEQAAGKALASRFEIQMPVVVLAKMKAGQVQDWQRLDQVWAFVGDKPAFARYVGGELRRMLAGDKIPVPDTKSSGPAGPMKSPAIPIPE